MKMPNELDNKVVVENPKSKGHAILIGTLGAGLIAALAGDGYLFVRSNDLRDQLAQNNETTQAQMAKLGQATTSLLDQRMQAIDEEIRNAQGSADTAVKRARMEALKQTKDLNQRLEDQQKAVSGELSDLKDATTTANSKITEVSS